MSAIIAYFDTDTKAVSTAEKLRGKGFRGEILIVPPSHQGVFNQIENQSERREKRHSSNTGMYGVTSGIGGAISLASTMVPRPESMITSNAISGLTQEVPKKKRQVLENIIQAGNTVIVIKDKEMDEILIKDVLKENEGELI